ncbi:MAG: HAMP domain-containing sensor histidine kinase [Candidatus Caenarcaniphilales bacterium]|nr:HAMP domain-containing sensor histidine kinase [Candidatus Caenarcaniphilales bacterium]
MLTSLLKFFRIPNKLLHQLLLTYLTIVFLSLAGIGGFTLFALKTSSINDLTYYLSLEAHNISSFLLERDREFVKNLADELSTHGFWVTVFDKKGAVEFSSIAEENLKKGNKSLQKTEAIREALEGKSKAYKFFSNRTQINWYLVTIPHLNKDGEIIGVVQVGLPLASLNQELGNSFYTLLCLGVLISLITIFAIWVLALWLSNPIKQISLQARQIADTGELKAELPVSRLDEIGELAKSFNMMIYKLREEKNFQKDFIANASHELKTPVTAISSALEILEHVPLENEEDKAQFFEILNRQTIRLKELITDLLDISVLESGRVELHLSSFSLEDFIENCIIDVEPLVNKADVDFSWFVESEIEIIADKDKLQRLLLNLLTNAIKHTPPKGEVLLSILTQKLSEDETEITFIVQDSGIGIPKEEQDKIFGRFYRAQQDRSRATGGSGLGLAIVKQIADLHGGKLSVKSDHAKGAEFRFEFKSVTVTKQKQEKSKLASR